MSFWGLLDKQRDELPKANAVDPFSQKMEEARLARKRQKAEEAMVGARMKEAVTALSDLAPTIQSSQLANFASSSTYQASPNAAQAAQGTSSGESSGSALIRAVQGSVNHITEKMSHNDELNDRLPSLKSRCEVISQILQQIPPNTVTTPAFDHELARIRQDVGDINYFTNKWCGSRDLERRKSAHIKLVKLEKALERDYAALQAIKQQRIVEKVDQMHEMLTRLAPQQNPDSRNIEQVDNLEFKRHIKNLLGYEPMDSFVLKGRIYDRDLFQISHGITFQVYRAFIAPSGERVAMKTYCETITTNGEGMKFVQRMIRHAGLWRSFQHETILECYGVNMQLIKDTADGDDRIQFYFVSPWMARGNAVNYLKKRKKNNAPTDILQIIKQAALGIRYLHKRAPPCVHASMRGENVLIKEDGLACINGFALTKSLSLDGKQIEMSGKTPLYAWMAPELVDHPSDPPLNPPGDIWSWAMTALELISGQQPYHKIRERDVPNEITAGRLPKESDHPEFRKYSPQPDMMWSLLQSCWNMNPEDRPTIDKVIDELDAIEKVEAEERAKRQRQ